MNENVILEKSKKFAVRIIKFSHYLKEEKKEFELSNQIIRSGTSIGANIKEAQQAQSNADFVNKLSIALKEANETEYWMEILVESEIIQESQIKDLYEANKELLKLLTSIIKSSKAKK